MTIATVWEFGCRHVHGSYSFIERVAIDYNEEAVKENMKH
jgi:hypothetical protein